MQYSSYSTRKVHYSNNFYFARGNDLHKLTMLMKTALKQLDSDIQQLMIMHCVPHLHIKQYCCIVLIINYIYVIASFHVHEMFYYCNTLLLTEFSSFLELFNKHFRTGIALRAEVDGYSIPEFTPHFFLIALQFGPQNSPTKNASGVKLKTKVF